MRRHQDTLPIVRPWPHLLRHLVTSANPLPALCALQQHHGDAYILDLGLTRLWVLTRPEHAQQILQHNAHNYRKGGQFETPLRVVIGNGSAVRDAERWRLLRTAALPHFRGSGLTGLPDFVDAAWRNLEPVIATHCAAGQPVNLSSLIECVSVSVACQQFGLAAPLHAELVAYVDALHTLLCDDAPLALATRLLPRVSSPATAQRQQAAYRLRELVMRWMRARLQQDAPRTDLFSALEMLAREDAPDLLDDHAALAAMLYDELMQILIAAHETVSAGLAWTNWLLFRHPATLEKVAAEVRAHTGGTVDSANGYLDAVINESLRLFPPAWRLTRRAVADDRIEHCLLPAGAPVMFFVFGLHRHPEFWPDPDVFRPERFLGVARRDLGWRWLPFGAGARSCIGGDMALMEMKLTLAWLLRRYTIVPAAAPFSAPPVNLAVTLRLRQPHLVHLHALA